MVPATFADPSASLVTGAAGGIGRGIAEVLAERGDLVLVADVDEAAAEIVAAELVKAGHSAQPVSLDVTDVEQVRKVVARLDAQTPLGAVVNNAAVAHRASLLEEEPERFDRLMSVNLRGAFFVMQAALRAMVPRGRGSVVNVCSTSSFTSSTGPMAAYDSSKAALKLITQAAAREVAAHGLRVNGIAPGTVETGLTLDLADSEELAALARERVPMGRLGRPREMGEAVAFLTSERASYVTGHLLAVDGGWLA